MKKSLVTAGLCLCILGPMSGVHAVMPPGFFDMIVSDPQSALAAFGPSRAGFTDPELDDSDGQIKMGFYYLDRSMGVAWGNKRSIDQFHALQNLSAAIETERAERIAGALAAAPLLAPPLGGAAPAAPLVAPPPRAAAVGAPGGPVVFEEPVSEDDTEPGGAAAADG